MRKVLSILMIIVILTIGYIMIYDLSNYDAVPEDNGARYETIEETLSAAGYKDIKVHYSCTDGELYLVRFQYSGGIRILHLYKDNNGFYSLGAVDDLKFKNKFVLSGLLGEKKIAGKYMITYTAWAFKGKILDVSDNYGNNFGYSEYITDKSTAYTHYIVLDEIPKDYRIYIDDEEFKLPTISGYGEFIIILIGILVILMIIYAINLYVTRHKRKAIKKAKEFKKRREEIGDIFK